MKAGKDVIYHTFVCTTLTYPKNIKKSWFVSAFAILLLWGKFFLCPFECPSRFHLSLRIHTAHSLMVTYNCLVSIQSIFIYFPYISTSISKFISKSTHTSTYVGTSHLQNMIRKDVCMGNFVTNFLSQVYKHVEHI